MGLSVSLVSGRADEAAELAPDQRCKANRRAVLEIRPDCLQADRQTAAAPAGRKRARRRAVLLRLTEPGDVVGRAALDPALGRSAPVVIAHAQHLERARRSAAGTRAEVTAASSDR